MSWSTMSLELNAQVPVPLQLCKKLINRAWVDLQRRFIWSFLWGDAVIPTPYPSELGTVTAQYGNAQVIGDAAATAQWATIPLVTPITTQQFRVGQGTIYNIIAYDTTTNAPFGTLTLDSPYVDPLQGVGIGYQIVGIYYNAPTPDFLWWESVRDPISGYTMATSLTREFVDQQDPQRFQSGWPNGFIPYRINPWPGNFNQYPMYEIWPAPLNNYTYVGTFFRRGMPFLLDSDTVIWPLTEDVVIEFAKTFAYEWCIANPDKCPKADYRFVLGKAAKQYQEWLSDCMRSDEEFSHRHIIEGPDNAFALALPWVSMSSNIMYAP